MASTDPIKDAIRIEFDQDGTFKPGEKVTGKVIVECRKPIKANYLRVLIYGRSYVSLTETGTTATIGLHGHIVMVLKRKSYTDLETQICDSNKLWVTTTGDNEIPAGTNAYPFSFTLPADAAPSFKGAHGNISYKVRCKLDVQGFHFNMKERKTFNVVPNVNLNRLRIKKNQSYERTENTGMIFKNGMISYSYTLPKNGYVAGETIVIPLEVDNQSKKPVHLVRAFLKQRATFWAEGHLDVTDKIPKNAKGQTKCSIAAGAKEVVPVKITVPTVIPTFYTKSIKVIYYLWIGVESTSTFKGKIEGCTEIIIGTVPIMEKVYF